jgi:hypothetical protein
MNRETIKSSTRATLTAAHGIDFTADFFTLSQSQACALADAAKAHGYRCDTTASARRMLDVRGTRLKMIALRSSLL